MEKPILLQDLGMMFPTEKSKGKKKFGIYKCNCGNEFKAQTSNITSGTTNSCGCYKIKKIKQSNTKHNLSNNKLYSIWKAMIGRCYNINSTRFEYYGKRKITVCDRWLDISNFIEDMESSYIDGLSIDRIDVNGNYSKENCRWVCQKIQMRNTRLLRKTNNSGYRGVCFDKSRKKFTSRITVNYKGIHLGRFNTALEAAKAYDNYVISNNLEHTINGV